MTKDEIYLKLSQENAIYMMALLAYEYLKTEEAKSVLGALAEAAFDAGMDNNGHR